MPRKRLSTLPHTFSDIKYLSKIQTFQVFWNWLNFLELQITRKKNEKFQQSNKNSCLNKTCQKNWRTNRFFCEDYEEFRNFLLSVSHIQKGYFWWSKYKIQFQIKFPSTFHICRYVCEVRAHHSIDSSESNYKKTIKALSFLFVLLFVWYFICFLNLLLDFAAFICCFCGFIYGSELYQWGLGLDIRKHFFTERVVKH